MLDEVLASLGNSLQIPLRFPPEKIHSAKESRLEKNRVVDRIHQAAWKRMASKLRKGKEPGKSDYKPNPYHPKIK
jgi:hypothetical protein